MQVEWRETSSLIPYARNARTHSDDQVQQVAASIKEFGWTNPILVDGENGIIAGHGRLYAAQKLGHDEVPVIELANMTEAQKRAYVIADNKLAENAGWDDELLKLELHALEEMDFSLDKLGFDPQELSGLMFDDPEPEPADDEYGSLEEHYSVLVELGSEDEQAKLLERLMGEGYDCRALTL